MSSEAETVEMLWWIVKPSEPSRMAKALQALRIRRIPHAQSGRDRIAVSELDTIEDEGLRLALGRQALSHNERSLVIPVANYDGTLSHTVSVPYGPLFGDRTQTHENN